MSIDAPVPAGIGNCRRCPYLETGSADTCYQCARQTIEALAPRKCAVCDLKLRNGTCGNPLCSWDISSRFFLWNYAIAMRSGVLKTAINDFKYENRRGWREVFGRVLVGFLDDEAVTFGAFNLIVASPTFVATHGARKYDHTRSVIEAADKEAGGRWPFDVAEPAVIVKTLETEKFVSKSWKERKQTAEGSLRAALSVTDPSRTKGNKILVYDDVFTDGFTLREVARCLIREGGATVVCGVTLTRQPYTS